MPVTFHERRELGVARILLRCLQIDAGTAQARGGGAAHAANLHDSSHHVRRAENAQLRRQLVRLDLRSSQDVADDPCQENKHSAHWVVRAT